MVIQITETKDATCIKISFEKNCNFDIYDEVKQLTKRLKKEDCFYHWYIFDDILLNLHRWVHNFKDRELNERSIYEFVKNNYEKGMK